MASKELAISPGCDIDDERKRRKLCNRESARRSRMRKQQRLDELIGQVSQIEEENKKVSRMIDDTNHCVGGEWSRFGYSGYPGFVARAMADALPESAYHCFY